MADEQATEEEPSIEEILDSIRQIISDDDEEGGEEAAPAEEAAPEPAPEPEAPPEPEPEPETPIEPDDVIELTEKVDPEPEPEPVAEEPEPEPEAPPEPEPEPEEAPIEVDMADVIEDDAESILTDTAQSAAYDGFSELARKTAVEHNGITLEEIVRSELNPLLKDWLDKHLPNIIDRLVKEELERISKRAETDLEEF